MKTGKIPFSIWALGIATFLINASSVIVFGLSAVYMKTILNIHTGYIGFLEGMVEACSYLTKLFSGALSDYMRKRKPIMICGFFMATLARPILAISSSFTSVFIARILDRIGNGIQSTPRDALVGDIAPNEIKGQCYGLRQALATAGSMTGGIIGFLAMMWTYNNFQYVFWIASIPAVLGLYVLSTLVKEPKHHLRDTNYRKFSWKDIPYLGKRFWVLMAVAGVFMLARVGEAMLILHANKNFQMDPMYTTLILVLYNGSNALASYPIGKLSDKMSRYILLGYGFAFLIIADLVLAFALNKLVMMIGVILWGIQIGITQSMFLALIADNVPNDLRGTGFGLFYMITAISLVLAGSIGGSIAHCFGETTMFLISAGIGLVSIGLLYLSTCLILKPNH